MNKIGKDRYQYWYWLLRLFLDRSPDSGFDSGFVSDYLFGLDWPSLSLGPFDIRSEWTHIYIKINL
jgi:hypothetical protein